MLLSQAQGVFTKNVALLILEMIRRGYDVTLGEAYRPQFVADHYASTGQGVKHSKHSDRLAIDLNLFKDGVYLSKTEDHTEFGAYWKKLNKHNRWGGDFTTRKDGNHYEMDWWRE